MTSCATTTSSFSSSATLGEIRLQVESLNLSQATQDIIIDRLSKDVVGIHAALGAVLSEHDVNLLIETYVDSALNPVISAVNGNSLRIMQMTGEIGDIANQAGLTQLSVDALTQRVDDAELNITSNAQAIAGKAETSDLSALESVVNLKANQATLDLLIQTHANDISGIETQIASLILVDQGLRADLNAVTTAIASKAEQTAVDALITQLAGKRDISDSYSKSEVDALINAGGSGGTTASVLTLTDTPAQLRLASIATTPSDGAVTVVTENPVNTTQNSDGEFSFIAHADNGIYYSWEWDAGTGTQWVPFVSSNGNEVHVPSFTVLNSQLSSGVYLFRCVIEGCFNTVTTQVARLTVN